MRIIGWIFIILALVSCFTVSKASAFSIVKAGMNEKEVLAICGKYTRIETGIFDNRSITTWVYTKTEMEQLESTQSRSYWDKEDNDDPYLGGIPSRRYIPHHVDKIMIIFNNKKIVIGALYF